jgi:NADPH-ferrihemoprotein reductase
LLLQSDLEDEQFVIFVLATYGEGEPTDNAKEFYEWIMEDDREPGCFSKVKFTIFGLGNKTYEHFCAVSRRVDARMAELGGNRIFQLGEGDDDAG